jgi:hypothetical protein
MHTKVKLVGYARAVDDVELIIVPLSLMEKWMTEHRSWYEFVILRTS